MSRLDDLRGELADPALDPERLAEIAYECPELRPMVAEHPALYDGLRDWLAVQEDPEVGPTVLPADVRGAAEGAGAADADELAPTQLGHEPMPTQAAYQSAAANVGYEPNAYLPPVPATPRRRGGIIAAIVIGCLVLVAAVIVAVVLVQRGTARTTRTAPSFADMCAPLDVLYSASLPEGGAVAMCGTAELAQSMVWWVGGERERAREEGLTGDLVTFTDLGPGDGAVSPLQNCGSAGAAGACLDAINGWFKLSSWNQPVDTFGDSLCPAWQVIADGGPSGSSAGEGQSDGGDAGEGTLGEAPVEATAEPSAGAYGVPLPQDTDEDQVRYLSEIIAKSKASRATLVETVNSLNACSSDDYAAALSRIESVSQNRRELLEALDSTPVDQIPNGDTLLANLREALNHSLAADLAFETWAGQIVQHGCPAGEPAHEEAVDESIAAAQPKKAFCEQWNDQIASAYGVAPVSAEEL